MIFARPSQKVGHPVPPLNEGGLGESSPKAAELLAALGYQIAFDGLVKGLDGAQGSRVGKRERRTS
jgi:hypothetical protein